MNLSLLDPFAVAKEYPEVLFSKLEFGHSTLIKSSYNSDYLASGTIDGDIVIIDLDTHGIIKILRNHTRAINSLRWSNCGRYLLSTSRDWKVNLWDLTANEPIRSLRFEGPIWQAEFSPKNQPFEIFISIFEDDCLFVNWEDKDDIRMSPISVEGSEESSNHYILTGVYHPSGNFLFVGTNKGLVNIISTIDGSTLFTEKITSSNVKNIILSQTGYRIAVNFSDRIIRQFKIPDLVNEEPENWVLEVEHKYQDVVNRLQWNSVSFNSNGEYLIASTFGSSHEIYIWETTMGSLVKILEGSKEELVDVDWNFKKCEIYAVGLDSGKIYMWGVIVPQKWSALAPDFVEIEENIEFMEREDEFDIIPENEMAQKNLELEEDIEVDLLTKDTIDARGFSIEKSFVIPLKLEHSQNLFE
ncbi:COMPASS component [Komagataella phaffii CBS 7435]|uniref:COMPASS component SWD1 n=2 Tax=Komagataella phaffii TaxID=460519 RepID=C4QYZ2_KOMPG|nr:COMPASS component SWD1 [Komagataella phaffii GS115]AOA61538.1 GQ67_01533T0 [Komagataella phaffii]CAH2447292.1 COMPASS component [Komagataella phaffii CBS 7435]AOA66019.1 GQ68_01549T0 [Komagataella phaffii GS115]CAY68466.1 COMPASS component SWD1 [Komagataella phaffii GS115]CCA37532.1 COMPASS component [Komagataella phaffii CBS 7435]